MTLSRTPVIALVGNPNTGKTTLFNALSGLHQRVGNYAGVTVESKRGVCRHAGREFDVVDLPGTYSLAARSPDEMVAVDVILGRLDAAHKPDVVVSIVDASNLERNLFLTTQVLDLGVPVIVALNMVDVATGLGVSIDVAKLEQKLGLPVVPMQANQGKGVDELIQTVWRSLERNGTARTSIFPDAFESEVAQVAREHGDLPVALARRLLLDVGGYSERVALEVKGPAFGERLTAARKRLADAGCGVPGIEARTRYAWIRRATDGCVQRPKERKTTWTDRIDTVLTQKIWGSLVFFSLMFLMFVAITTGAAPLMDAVDAGRGWLADLVKGAMEPGAFRSLLVDGIIGGVGGVLIFLPQILILFAFLAILEDCGYMARAAYLMDRVMARAGLNGKSFIPLLSSVACAIPGIMAARVIENRRDRLATILVAPLMSCSARLPVYLLFVGAFFPTKSWLPDGDPQAAAITLYPFWVPGLILFGMYAIGFVLAPIVAFVLKKTTLRGETPPFVMEMPLYKRPSLKAVVRRALEAGWMFTRRAGTVILASMIVVWALLYFPATAPDGESYETKLAELEAKIAEPIEERDRLVARIAEAPGDVSLMADRLESLEAQIEPVQASINALNQEWKAQSILGRAGKAIEPAVVPLGWDWRLAVATLASFPAREVIVGVLGIIYGEGDVDPGDDDSRETFGRRLREDPAFNVPVALSVMVFFALCAQCASTIAIIRREAGGWRWAIFSFVYMTALAYVGALATYQVGRLFV